MKMYQAKPLGELALPMCQVKNKWMQPEPESSTSVFYFRPSAALDALIHHQQVFWNWTLWATLILWLYLFKPKVSLNSLT